jgi:hypothetical protein
MAALSCVVGATVFVAKPAKAADLGGDCCADLEERVAELEATTARKGNKKVSVQIYGKVNRAVMFWDDGGEQNVYSVDNYNESSRTGFKGNAKISDDWSAGYRLEWEYRMAASSRVNQFEDDNANDPSMIVRWSQMYLASNQKKWFAPGETAFWGGYAQVNDGWAPGSNGNGGNLGGIPADSILKPGTFANIGVPVEITGSEVDRWFLFHLYAAYQHFNADLDLVTRDLAVSPHGKLKSVGESIDDFDVFYTGGRLYF